jgi:uncharacterized membrane protein
MTKRYRTGLAWQDEREMASAPPPSSASETVSDAARRQWQRAEDYVQSQMTWNRTYRLVSYARSALWIAPSLAMIVVLLISPPLRWLDSWLGWRLTGLSVDGAQALYQTVITLTLSFIVFTFGSLLVAVQIAGGQLTPRIIATTLLRDNVVRYSVGLFVFALIFSVTGLNRLVEPVQQIVVFTAGLLGLGSMTTFLFLIDYAARLLRPVTILARVGDEASEVIRAVYPRPFGVEEGDEQGRPPRPPGPTRVVLHEGRSESVLALDITTLVAAARRAGGIIEFVPQVGDFVASETPLFVLHAGATRIDDRALRIAVAFGPERTLEQDPLFGFRILVDIGLKALSPAINDPTTGVLALDQIQRLLRAVGKRHLQGEVVADRDGEPRVIWRTPDWNDFVHLACHEIRICGASNAQIARRLRAMIEFLLATLPAPRHAALLEERQLLEQTVATHYPLPADLALASIPDSQGLGSGRAGTGPGETGM